MSLLNKQIAIESSNVPKVAVGALAGTLFGLINQVVVEPYIDRAVGIQTQNAINSGQMIMSTTTTQQSNYRMWQKGGEIAAGAIYGISLSALFGVIFA